MMNLSRGDVSMQQESSLFEKLPWNKQSLEIYLGNSAPKCPAVTGLFCYSITNTTQGTDQGMR